MTLYESIAHLENDNGWQEAKRILNNVLHDYDSHKGNSLVDYLTVELKRIDEAENKNQLHLFRNWY